MPSFLRYVPLTLVLLAAACADKPVAPYPISEPANKLDAAFGAGDLFDVRVFGEPELTGTYQVSTDGAIAFPLIGRVEVFGKLPSQVEAEIQSRLGDGFLKSPQVSVLPKESRSKKVSVLGQVKQPGVFLYADSMSIVEAVSKAGGFTAIARKNAVRVTRDSADAKVATFIVAVDDIGRGKAPNFFLRPGDVIYVPERPF
jgi:protein involved in polysaccharide export with SLBB domain